MPVRNPPGLIFPIMDDADLSSFNFLCQNTKIVCNERLKQSLKIPKLYAINANKSVRKFRNLSQCPRNTQALTKENSDFLKQCTVWLHMEQLTWRTRKKLRVPSSGYRWNKHLGALRKNCVPTIWIQMEQAAWRIRQKLRVPCPAPVRDGTSSL